MRWRIQRQRQGIRLLRNLSWLYLIPYRKALTSVSECVICLPISIYGIPYRLRKSRNPIATTSVQDRIWWCWVSDITLMGRTKRIIATRFSSLPIQRVLSRIIDGSLSPLEKSCLGLKSVKRRQNHVGLLFAWPMFFTSLLLDTPLFVALIPEGRL